MQKPFVFQCVMRCLQLFYLKDRIPFLIVAVFDAFRVDFTTVYLIGKLRQRVHAFSEDGLHWAPQKGVLAYSKEVLWDDGKGVAWSAPSCCLKMGRRPTLFATSNGEDDFMTAKGTWNMVIPLKKSE